MSGGLRAERNSIEKHKKGKWLRGSFHISLDLPHLGVLTAKKRQLLEPTTSSYQDLLVVLIHLIEVVSNV